MHIPDPKVPFERVLAEVRDGKAFWAMRGKPDRRSQVEVFYVSLVDDGEEMVPGVDYVGGFWADESGGEEDYLDLNEAIDELDLQGLLWHRTERPFPPGYTPEYTVQKLLAA